MIFKRSRQLFASLTAMRVRFLFCFLIACSCFTVSAQQSTEQGQKLFAQCIACHGDKAQGNEALKSPRLAGQYQQYLSRQLLSFKQGIRGSHSDDNEGRQMQAIAKGLSDNDIEQLAQYIAQLDTPKIENKVTGSLKNGSRYYYAKCGACHGGQAQGNTQFSAPSLSNQHASYLNRQILHFQQGIRGVDAKDKYGRQMAMMSKVISTKDWQDILFYISQQ